ncbi:hypothetical protein [Desulfotomaculum sp. 1211_IL3151]|uniref:hypothetical protein n=1 Tax=Desulfotomaculum sp. 1211_IL3151 TaxID=3084055 RepID=UPI002FDB4354
MRIAASNPITVTPDSNGVGKEVQNAIEVECDGTISNTCFLKNTSRKNNAMLRKTE